MDADSTFVICEELFEEDDEREKSANAQESKLLDREFCLS